MRVIGFGAAELVIRHCWSRAIGGRPTGKILHVAAPSRIADENVELTVGSKGDHTSIVVTSLRLPGILLDSTEHDQVVVQGQAGSIPDETIHPVAQQGGI